MQVRVVTAFVPLKVRHLTVDQYKDYGRQLVDACDGNITVFDDYPLEKCWSYPALSMSDMRPAQDVPADRYSTPYNMLESNCVQHNRTNWAMQAGQERPDVDCWVWLDYAILKQGDFTGKRVTAQVIRDFLRKLAALPGLYNIPFPGIWDKGDISTTGANWRFCGSTHIWPRIWLPQTNMLYQSTLLCWLKNHNTMPNDLPIWATVERDSGLPFRWYAANHDATQLTNFPTNFPGAL